MMRMIFSTVRAPQEPALTVESLAISATGRPSMVAVPVTTPSAGRSSATTLAKAPSSTKDPSSTSSRTRSRAKSLPLPALAWWYFAAPPRSTRARSSGTGGCSGRGLCSSLRAVGTGDTAGLTSGLLGGRRPGDVADPGSLTVAGGRPCRSGAGHRDRHQGAQHRLERTHRQADRVAEDLDQPAAGLVAGARPHHGEVARGDEDRLLGRVVARHAGLDEERPCLVDRAPGHRVGTKVEDLTDHREGVA